VLIRPITPTIQHPPRAMHAGGPLSLTLTQHDHKALPDLLLLHGLGTWAGRTCTVRLSSSRMEGARLGFQSAAASLRTSTPVVPRLPPVRWRTWKKGAPTLIVEAVAERIFVRRIDSALGDRLVARRHVETNDQDCLVSPKCELGELLGLKASAVFKVLVALRRKRAMCVGPVLTSNVQGPSEVTLLTRPMGHGHGRMGTIALMFGSS